jgi:hypothetical protein
LNDVTVEGGAAVAQAGGLVENEDDVLPGVDDLLELGSVVKPPPR